MGPFNFSISDFFFKTIKVNLLKDKLKLSTDADISVITNLMKDDDKNAFIISLNKLKDETKDKAMDKAMGAEQGRPRSATIGGGKRRKTRRSKKGSNKTRKKLYKS